jgi:hypothetical protein
VAELSPRLTTVVRTLSWPLATGAGVRVLEGLLRGEVVYTALGVLSLALLVAACSDSALRDSALRDSAVRDRVTAR